MTTGIVFALLAGVSFAAFQLLNRGAGKKLGLVPGMTILLATCLAGTSLIVALTEGFASFESVSASGWLLLAAGGLFHFVAGFSLINLSQRSVGTGRTGSLVGTTPLFATLTGLIILGEVVSLSSLVGIAMIVLGAVLVSTQKR